MTDDFQSMEVSGYLCTLISAGLVGIEPSRNIYVPTTAKRLGPYNGWSHKVAARGGSMQKNIEQVDGTTQEILNF